MAIDASPNPNETPEQKAAREAALSKTASVVNTPSSSTTPQSSRPTGTSSGRFVNLQNYLRAGQGTDLAGKIGQGAQTQAADVRAGIESQLGKQEDGKRTGGTFQEQAKAGRNIYDASTIGGILGRAGSNLSPEDEDKFKSSLSGTYGGPTSLENEAALGEKAARLEAMQRMAGTEAGRGQLLSQVYGRPSYTAGQRKLDTALLQAKPGSLTTLQDQAKAAALGAKTALTSGQQEAADLAKGYTKEAEATRGLTQEALTGATKDLSTAIGTPEAAEAARHNLYLQAQKGLGEGEITSDVAQKLGLSAIPELYGTDLSQFLSESGTKASQENLANSDQYAKMAALQKLGGQQTWIDPKKAGTFGENQLGYSMTPKTLADKIESNKADYLAKINPELSKLAGLEQEIASLEPANFNMDWSTPNKSVSQLRSSAAENKELNPEAAGKMLELAQKIEDINKSSGVKFGGLKIGAGTSASTRTNQNSASRQ